MLQIEVNTKRVIGIADEMIYGHFLEHFHRQIYDGIYDNHSALSNSSGFRADVIEALKQIRTPVMRWPGGCFVSSYHWKNGVGKVRTPSYDKAWRVEDSNEFGTDEFACFCKEVGCEPYICTNAGTGTEEEMSDWVEYCNLTNEGAYAKQRIANGYIQPHNVKYWSVGNENWGSHEIGAKTAEQWGHFVAESCKMMRKVDPTIILSAAALADTNWNLNLLKYAADYLDLISIHSYWDELWENNNLSSYEQCMIFTEHTGDDIIKVRGLLNALGIKHIKIAYDEWNMRSWHHPHMAVNAFSKSDADYLTPRNESDRNTSYTMADAVFTACFLNTCNKNSDIVKMANYAPSVNTRGLIYTHENGIVKRTTYHVFDLYVNYMERTVVDLFIESENIFQAIDKKGGSQNIHIIDSVATISNDKNHLTIALVNKHPEQAIDLSFSIDDFSAASAELHTLTGNSVDSYNDVDCPDSVVIKSKKLDLSQCKNNSGSISITIQPHSVNILDLRK